LSWEGNEIIADVSSSESLYICLRVKHIMQSAMLECVRCIQSNYIAGRSAVCCISEIRISIISFLKDSTDNFSIEKIETLFNLGEIILNPLIDVNDSINLQPYIMCLDLIPPIVSTLSMFKKKFTKKWNEDNRIEIVDSIFFIAFTEKLILPLSNLLWEIYPFLKKKNLLAFKVYT
jgi:hypothetical protein